MTGSLVGATVLPLIPFLVINLLIFVLGKKTKKRIGNSNNSNSNNNNNNNTSLLQPLKRLCLYLFVTSIWRPFVLYSLPKKVLEISFDYSDHVVLYVGQIWAVGVVGEVVVLWGWLREGRRNCGSSNSSSSKTTITPLDAAASDGSSSSQRSLAFLLFCGLVVSPLALVSLSEVIITTTLHHTPLESLVGLLVGGVGGIAVVLYGTAGVGGDDARKRQERGGKEV
jgi:hypothetical protein